MDNELPSWRKKVHPQLINEVLATQQMITRAPWITLCPVSANLSHCKFVALTHKTVGGLKVEGIVGFQNYITNTPITVFSYEAQSGGVAQDTRTRQCYAFAGGLALEIWHFFIRNPSRRAIRETD